MSNVVKFKMSWKMRWRVFWRKYGVSVRKRMDYLDKISKDS